jgi:methionyl-tRNA synthetase
VVRLYCKVKPYLKRFDDNYVAILLQPAIPESADRILNYLDVPKDERFLRHAIIRTEGAQSSIKNSKPFVAISKIINTKVR